MFTVKVYLSLDELERHGKEHIMVHVCVNGDHFVKILPGMVKHHSITKYENM